MPLNYLYLIPLNLLHSNVILQFVTLLYRCSTSIYSEHNTESTGNLKWNK